MLAPQISAALALVSRLSWTKRRKTARSNSGLLMVRTGGDMPGHVP